MQPTAVQVISIHDQDASGLSFDLKDLLQALRDYLGDWTWHISDLEPASGGEFSESIAQAVESSGGAGYWLSTPKLLRLAEDLRQTIDGTWTAFPATADSRQVAVRELCLDRFPSSQAVLAIRAVDSSFFEIYAKDSRVTELLREHFRDVRREDPATYFDPSSL